MSRISPALMVVGLLPSLAIVWILWLAPIDGLGADRTAMALRDYTALWAAGKLATAHAFDVLTDPARFNGYIRGLFGPGMPTQIWPYPPGILPLAGTMARLPLLPGFLLYSLFGLVVLATSLRAGRLSWRAVATVMLSPAVAANLLAGQNGAIMAALAFAGLVLIDRRPMVAGLLLGLLSIKPQFALLLPFCLLAGRRWQTMAAAGLSASFIVGLTTLVFGFEPWLGFLASNHSGITDHAIATWHGGPSQSIFTSAFMAARASGASLAVSSSCQIAVIGLAAFLAWRLWSDKLACPHRRAAAALALALMAAPWVHNYDMPALAASVVLLKGEDTRWRRALVGFAWLWPGLPPLVPVSPLVSFLSVASVAWLAVGAARSRVAQPTPGSDRSILLSSA